MAFHAHPPLAEVFVKTFIPERINETNIFTFVGGIVGGCISLAGVHRLLEAGICGKENIASVSRSSVLGIVVASLMRVILFLAVLGIVWQGISLSKENPAATVFQSAAGLWGYKIFGLVLWSAAITSVVGSAFTSVTFAKLLHPLVRKHFRFIIIGFILFSTTIFLWVGHPVKVLVAAGAVNGIILPIALAIIMLAAHKKKIVGDYRNPYWLTTTGWLVVVAMGYLAVKTIVNYLSG